jgi:hypothetical protein
MSSVGTLGYSFPCRRVHKLIDKNERGMKTFGLMLSKLQRVLIFHSRHITFFLDRESGATPETLQRTDRAVKLSGQSA